MQISDIHLSIVNKLAVAVDLRLFCTETVPTIAPALVLVTGGLCSCRQWAKDVATDQLYVFTWWL